jgi:hypothetical protein
LQENGKKTENLFDQKTQKSVSDYPGRSRKGIDQSRLIYT